MNKGHSTEPLATDTLHTQVPWKANMHMIGDTPRWFIQKNELITIAAMNSPCVLYSNAEADARRIVACVNYCEGVGTAELEAAPADLKLRRLLDFVDNDTGKLLERYDLLRSQLKEMREAFSRADETLCGPSARWFKPTLLYRFLCATIWRNNKITDDIARDGRA